MKHVFFAVVFFSAFTASAQEVWGTFSNGMAAEFRMSGLNVSIGTQGFFFEPKLTALSVNEGSFSVKIAPSVNFSRGRLQGFIGAPIFLRISETTSFELMPWGKIIENPTGGVAARLATSLAWPTGGGFSVAGIWKHPVLGTGFSIGIPLD